MWDRKIWEDYMKAKEEYFKENEEEDAEEEEEEEENPKEPFDDGFGKDDWISEYVGNNEGLDENRVRMVVTLGVSY
jgi:hypothetical protein